MKIYLILSLTLVMSCSKNLIKTDHEELTGLWLYESGLDIQQPYDWTRPYLAMHQDNSFTGYTSRNWISGNFTRTENNYIKFDHISSTYVADTEWSGAFFKTLNQTNKYQTSGNSITLTGGEQTMTFEIATCKKAENNKSDFTDVLSDVHQIINLRQLGPCLEVTVQYGGGCKPVTLDLVGGGDYAESQPPQLSVRTIMDDNDNCEAAITEPFYFDLENLRYTDGPHQLWLNFEGTDSRILVRYE